MTETSHLQMNLARLGRETAALMATVESLSGPDWARPSRCGGWSRADLVAHLAGNARGLARMVDWAVTGREQQMYSSPEARAEEITMLAALPSTDLIAELRDSAAHFASEAKRLAGNHAVDALRIGRLTVPSAFLVAQRTTEVVVHHADLAAGWNLEDAEPESLREAIEAAVRAMRTHGAPGVRLMSHEGDEWTLDGAGPTVTAGRANLLEWLARGETDGVEAEGPLPELPAW